MLCSPRAWQYLNIMIYILLVLKNPLSKNDNQVDEIFLENQKRIDALNKKEGKKFYTHKRME